MGTKGRPFYRIVAAPTSAGRDGRFVEQLGHYDPLQEPSLVKVDRERVLHWLKNGASPSDTLVRLLKKEGIWEDFESGKSAPKPRRKPVKARVKKEKPVKEKKRKPAPAAEASEDAAESSSDAAEPSGETAESSSGTAEPSGDAAESSSDTAESSGDAAESSGEAAESSGGAAEAPAEEEPAQ